MNKDLHTIALYRAGCYLFNPPPVCHIGWNEAQWINYIGENGFFEPKTEKQKYNYVTELKRLENGYM